MRQFRRVEAGIPRLRLGGAQRTELAQTILEESQRLDRHVRNLLDMTRLSRPGLALREQSEDCLSLNIWAPAAQPDEAAFPTAP